VRSAQWTFVILMIHKKINKNKNSSEYLIT
jgi:hypothetical protein